MQILVALIHVYTLLTTYFTPDSNINNQQCISTGVRSEVAKYKTCLFREIAVVTGDFYICLLFLIEWKVQVLLTAHCLIPFISFLFHFTKSFQYL